VNNEREAGDGVIGRKLFRLLIENRKPRTSVETSKLPASRQVKVNLIV
jgi:hypothetical protein